MAVTAAEETVDRAAEPSSPADWYGAGVRPTDKRTPEQERAGFHLPPGFTIELVAAEPKIAKPLNMAFDARGRLWLTDTYEYPYPAPAGREGGDSIKVLEDADSDGNFEKVTVFANGLNIPIGLLPYRDGVICFSIPNILFLRDTDGDGRCDQREHLYGPFDTTRDTHGMVNAMRWGDDGWIYACHGFNNNSKVSGKDGHVVEMSSGNTFRFRPDGSRIELNTQGQVNPFGMTTDKRGQRYTADCHSVPLTQLIPGGCYPSFGRPHDGLGFAHSMMDHLHGSTAISGIVFYEDEPFPDLFRDSFYSGNVMTSRINRDTRKRIGTTEIAVEQGDFLTSDDPWFRPVDIQLGLDGTLYVADFYNKIIGHYEVPLDHPGRDRDSGRIWRIRVNSNSSTGRKPVNLAVATQSQLIEQLGSPNITRRTLASREILERIGNSASDGLRNELRESSNPLSRAHCLWLLVNFSTARPADIERGLSDSDPLVRLHAATAVASLSEEHLSKVASKLRYHLQDADPDVARAAVASLGTIGDEESFVPLLDKLDSIPENDTVLRQTTRIALRRILLKPNVRQRLLTSWRTNKANDPLGLNGRHHAAIASILLGVRHSDAATLLLLSTEASTQTPSAETIKHIANWIPESEVARFIAWIEEQYDQQPEQQLSMFRSIEQGLQSGGTAQVPEMRAWSIKIAKRLLAPLVALPAEAQLVRWSTADGKPWETQTRRCEDQLAFDHFQSSITRGEAYTGTLQSSVFPAPKRLQFWVVGHNGLPDQPDSHKNRVEVVSVGDQRVLFTAFPPRSDIAKLVTWESGDTSGTPVILRCVDEDAGDAFAWIGVGRFSAAGFDTNSLQGALSESLSLVSSYSLHELDPELKTLSSLPSLDLPSRLEVESRRAELQSRRLLGAVASAIAKVLDRSSPNTFDWVAAFETTLDASADQDPTWQKETLPLWIKQFTSAEQKQLATHLSSQREGAVWLVDALEQGWISPTILEDIRLRQSLEAICNSRSESERWSKIVLSLPEVDSAANERWQKSLNAWNLARSENRLPDLTRGAAVFKERCSQCHQLRGEGKIVGPQLDGVRGRGAARLLEDILLPNRNVDHAFRTSTLLMEDGQVLVGLVRNENKETLNLVDSAGKESLISVGDIVERKENSQSVMPGNLHELITEEQLRDLLGHIMTQ